MQPPYAQHGDGQTLSREAVMVETIVHGQIVVINQQNVIEKGIFNMKADLSSTSLTCSPLRYLL
jgi:hypothetical protein